MNSIEPNFQMTLDGITSEYAPLQITCILMQHEGCNKIRNNDSENGMMILDAVKAMRDTLAEQKAALLNSVGQQEFEDSCKRTGYDRMLYTSLSDAAIKDNTIYFELAPRPAGDAYKCDELICKAKGYALALEYFPSLYGKAA